MLALLELKHGNFVEENYPGVFHYDVDLIQGGIDYNLRSAELTRDSITHLKGKHLTKLQVNLQAIQEAIRGYDQRSAREAEIALCLYYDEDDVSSLAIIHEIKTRLVVLASEEHGTYYREMICEGIADTQDPQDEYVLHYMFKAES